MSSLPFEISLIVPTHNRSARLRLNLDALARQTFPTAKMQVVVVANGCRDDTLLMLRQYRAPFALTIVEQEDLGAAAARNAGVMKANGRLLLFLDDDIEATPTLVQSHVNAHQDRANVVAIGYMPPMFSSRRDFLSTGLHAWWEDIFAEMSQPAYRHDYRSLLSGNFSVSASLFSGMGGFNAKMRCREDYELGARLIKVGASFVFLAGAVGYHHEEPDLERSLRRRRSEGHADVVFGGLHPELLPTLPMFGLDTSRKIPWKVRFVFRWPSLGDRLARYLLHVLRGYERFRMRRNWQKLYNRLRHYSYWRGVTEALPSEAALRRIISLAGDHKKHAPDLEIDLSQGIEHAEGLLNARRPMGASLSFRGMHVGRIPAKPGAERLRGTHLRPLLARDFGVSLVRAMALEGACPLPEHLTRLRSPHTEPTCPNRSMVSEHQAIFVGEIILPTTLDDIVLEKPYNEARFLVRYRGRPLGWISLPTDGQTSISASLIQKALADTLGLQIVHQHVGRPIIEVPERPSSMCPISVVVCTRDRTALLARCMESLLTLDYPEYEIIVVDNAPQTEDTARLVATLPIRYVREDRPGLNFARNRGIAEARHDLIAFTDDDTLVDRLWLRGFSRAFTDAVIVAATGLVLPLELETSAQVYFEDVYGGMQKGLYQRRFEKSNLHPSRLLWSSDMGVGANMAFRRAAFDQVGEFDVALDLGTPSRGGGDIEMFHRVVAAGCVLAYEPQALVWHRHRSESDALRRQMYDNGCSFGVYLITCFFGRTLPKPTILSFALREWIAGWLLGRLFLPGTHSRRMVWSEIRGMLVSPLAYRATRRRTRGMRSLSNSNSRARMDIVDVQVGRGYSAGEKVGPPGEAVSAKKLSASA